MKILRNRLFLLLLIILIIGVPFAAVNWEAIQEKLGLKRQFQETVKKEAIKNKAKKEVVQTDKPEKKTATVNVKKETESEQKRPVFQVANIRREGGQITGFAPTGWKVILTSSGQQIGSSTANKKDGRWVVSLDKKYITNGKLILELSAVSPDNKRTLESPQKLEIIFAKNGETRVVRIEPGKKPFVLQEIKETPVKTVKKPEKKKETVTVKKTEKVEVKKEKQTASAAVVPEKEKAGSQDKKRKDTTEQDKSEKKKERVPGPNIVTEKPDILTLETFEFKNNKEDQSDLVLKGKANPGAKLNIILNNKVIGTSLADKDGLWSFRETLKIDPAKHNIRIQQVKTQKSVEATKERKFVPKKVVRKKTEETASPVNTGTVKKKEVPKKKGISSEVKEVKTAKNAEQNPAGKEKPKVVGQDARINRKSKSVRVIVGDTLWGIAVLKYGKGYYYWRIYRANRRKIKNPHRIYPGQKFRLP